MQNSHSTRLQRALTLLVGLLIVKVTIAVVLGFRNYFPPNFESDFLNGRQSYFFGSYQWAFYSHLASGPVSLILGLILISEQFRRRFPKWHRFLGRIQTACVLLVVTPSGLWMAYHTSTGPIAGIAFAVLAVLTGTCVAIGWRLAVKRRFAEHRRWMSRCFLLLCSAVVLRLVAGLATVMDVDNDWFDPLASWGCWMVPLAVFELVGLRNRRRR
jgi:uncharacterized membrane protein YozB (DUF420 family)